MTSSENLASFAAYEPWMMQSTAAYADSWLTEAFARDAETLTRALQKTISGDTNNNSDTVITSSDAISSFYQHTPTASGVSGSDPEMATTTGPRRRVAVTPAPATKKITKRKPRATKKSQTTFIMADPANFRQMVQQVTGVRFETLQQQNHHQPQLIVKPEPKRLTGAGFCLPTLDTSSFLLNRDLNSQLHQQQEEYIGAGQTSLTGDDPLAHVAFGDSLVDGQGRGYEPYQCFPTLESWKVM